ncbi:MAG: crossover junction endodeoxyribonuclease RuvC [Candidatus Sumerlaeia bacterium]|nr:crossover junction endodeoxyribonuclease RuvC [Candidatus Sumerlaeia bacterium]
MPERVILGVDPGLASAGVGAIAVDGAGRARALGWRQATTSPRTPLPDRLAAIHDLVEGALREFRPEAMGIEDVFFAKNVKSAVALAHGRAAAILAARRTGIPVLEFAPREVKLAVTGRGGASKEQVKQIAALLLRLAEPPKSDHESDALAIALCAAFRLAPGAVRSAAAKPPAGEPEDPRKALLAQMRRGRRRRR